MPELTIKDIEQLLDNKIEGLATKADIEAIRQDMVTKDDLTSELRPIKSQLHNMEAKLDRISTRTNEDALATMKDIDKLTSRVKTLEEEVKQLKPRHAA